MNLIIRGVILFLAISFGSNVSALESPQPIGFFCGSDTTSIVVDQFYVPQSGCVYLSPTISGSRYGDIYRGTVGSSTIVNGHFLGFNSTSSIQSGDSIPDPHQGENLFVAIFPAQFVNEFRTFFQTGAGATIGNNYGFLPFKYGTPPPPEPDEPDPVIIIPGILGSEQRNGEWIIDPILHTYDDLIATLDVNHYTPEFDLFMFPYNWRKSNVETAVLLKEKIDAVKEICQCDKVDLVAHSMGGLVARQYIQSEAYEQDVDQLIFLGTPHLGAPKAYLMWEGGEIGPFRSAVDQLTEVILRHEGYEKGYPTLFAYLRATSIDSVRELLPMYNYIFDTSSSREYPQNYPTNQFLESLNSNYEALLNSGVEIHNIVGDVSEQKTIVAIKASDPSSYLPMWEHGYPENYYDLLGDNGLERGRGDNTVPLPSASFIDSNLFTTPFRHNDLPFETQADVYHMLTGEDAMTVVREHLGLNVKLIIFKILSPADLLVIAPDGKKVGKENDIEINQIQNAFYTGFTTETEYITILNPVNGEYRVVTAGTDTGSYTVETTYIGQEEAAEVSFTGNTTPGLMTELMVSINSEHLDELEIQPTDIEAPVITITTPETRDYLRSEQMQVNISAIDPSGTFALEAFFGTTTIPNVGTIDLFFKKLGIHMLTASSSDNLGNATTSTRSFRIIATPDSTLSDINRAYSLGWMTKKFYGDFMRKFKTTIKISAIVEKGTDGKPKGEKIQKKVDKILATALIFELNRQRGNGLNEQAYQLLKEDIQWLINNSN